jgi:TetR/AcrR family transcriptional regulator, transcriptional repressor for nem operon
MLKSVVGSLSTRTRARGPGRGRDTCEEILNAAEELLQRRGYNAFSYHHIAVQLGVRNAAIHYHFPSKEDLGVALVKRYQDRFRSWVLTTDELDNAWAQLQAYFQTYLDFLEADCKCCPGGVLGNEFNAIPEAMREQARTLMGEVYDWMVRTLDRGRIQGVLTYAGKAEDKAVEIGAALQGGLQIARLAGPERFHQVLAQLSLELTGRPQYAVNLAA